MGKGKLKAKSTGKFKAKLSNTRAKPSNTRARPSNTRAKPSNTGARPSNARARPSNIRAGPSNTRPRTSYSRAVKSTTSTSYGKIIPGTFYKTPTYKKKEVQYSRQINKNNYLYLLTIKAKYNRIYLYKKR